MIKLRSDGLKINDWVFLGSEAGRPDLATVVPKLIHASTKEDLELLAPMAPATLVAEMLPSGGPVSVVSTACIIFLTIGEVFFGFVVVKWMP